MKAYEINETKITDLTVLPWLYDCKGSCGQEVYESPVCEHEVFYLRASDDYGKSWILEKLEGQDEQIVLAKIKQVKEHLDKGGRLNPSHWREDRPVYGSKAYQAFEQEEIAPVADALNSGFLHENDIPDSLKAYF